MADPCAAGGPKKPNGNCAVPADDDGLPVQCVGPWAALKHDYLARYIEATWAPRAKFLGPGRGGACFVDLFAGPGRARVRDSGDIVNGSPLIALEHSRARFSRTILCDLDPENIATLRERTKHYAERVVILEGDCNERIGDICAAIPRHGLNLAFVDPFGVKPLSWQTLASLARLERMDMVIHFPTNTIKRNLRKNGFHSSLTRFLGTSAWRSPGLAPQSVRKALECLLEQLEGLGYQGDHVRTLPVRNSGNGLMYHLVFASKAPLGTKIWRSISTVDVSGQRSLW